MKGSHKGQWLRVGQYAPLTLIHLLGRLVGKGHRQQTFDIHAALNQTGNFVGQRTGLAGPRSGNDH